MDPLQHNWIPTTGDERLERLRAAHGRLQASLKSLLDRRFAIEARHQQEDRGQTPASSLQQRREELEAVDARLAPARDRMARFVGGLLELGLGSDADLVRAAQTDSALTRFLQILERGGDQWLWSLGGAGIRHLPHNQVGLDYLVALGGLESTDQIRRPPVAA